MGGCPLGKCYAGHALPGSRIAYRVNPEQSRQLPIKPSVIRQTLPLGQSIHLESSITQQQLLVNADCILNSYMLDRLSSDHVVR